MLLTKSRISLISIGLIFLMGLATFLLVERASADDFGASNDENHFVVWNWDTSGTTVQVDFNIDAYLDGDIVEIEIFVDAVSDTDPIHTQRMGNFGPFPTGESLSFNFLHGTDVTSSTLSIHLLERVGGTSVMIAASSVVGTVPLPIADPLTPPTPTPAATATATVSVPTPTVAPEPEPEPPPVGDFAPGSGLLLGLMLAGFLLIAAGGTYMAQHRRPEQG
jgi:hypothetical protein